MFTILLPTRNRLGLLKLAVESVLRQSYKDFEIVISDNNSKESVKEYVYALNDKRVIYSGFDHSVSVTENWNNALSKANGDYIIMLGDDDALCLGYFETLSRIIKEWNYPDCIYTGAYMFTYKGVLPGNSHGMVYENKNSIFWRNSYEPYWLSHEKRLSLVNDSMRLVNSYGFNMQYVTVSRKVVDNMTGNSDFYQTQYPDYYAMNNLLINVERFLVVEIPLVAIGTSSSSFGWYFHNLDESSGNKVLNIEKDMVEAEAFMKQDVLPGTTMNTNWLTSMIKLYADNHNMVGLLPPSVKKYRRKQIIYFVLLLSFGKCSVRDIKMMKEKLDPVEMVLYYSLKSVIPTRFLGRRILKFIHIASQKRVSYMIRALIKKMLNQSPVTIFSDNSTILDIEGLLKKGI